MQNYYVFALSGESGAILWQHNQLIMFNDVNEHNHTNWYEK